MSDLECNSGLEYKVGDRVQIIASNGTEDWFNPEAEVILGTVVVVNSTKDLDQYLVKVDDYVGIYDGGLFAFREEHLVLIERELEKDELELTQADESKTIYDKLTQGISKISIGDQPAMITPSNTPVKVKSDGGSSSYYFSKLPKEIIDEIVEKGGIELKDVVKYCFYNDADVKDITKAIKRIMEDLRGGGKEGIDAHYDLNKIKFFFDEFEKSVLIQKREQEEAKDD